MTGLQIIHQRIREIGYVKYVGGCVAWGLFVYILALIFTLWEVIR